MRHDPDSSVRIARVEPLSGKSAGVRLHLTDGDPLEVNMNAWLASELAVGEPLTRALRSKLEALDRKWAVRDAALSLLSYRARSRKELARALSRKNHRPADIDTVLEELEERGLLDDRAFAETLVRDRVRQRPRGRRRLVQELRQKGVQESTAEAAIEAALEDEETDEASLAREVGARWARTQSREVLAHLLDPEFTPEREKARRRLYGHLARRGFLGPALQAGTEAAQEEARARLD